MIHTPDHHMWAYVHTHTHIKNIQYKGKSSVEKTMAITLDDTHVEYMTLRWQHAETVTNEKLFNFYINFTDLLYTKK